MGNVTSRFRPLFYPNSVAVVGASDNPSKLSYLYLKNLVEGGYKGSVYPVNPRLEGKEVLGLKFYSDLLDIPGEVDLALIAVGARSVIDVLRRCSDKGVKAAIVFASGFAESGGHEGRVLELEVRKIAEESGMVIVGPNCLGVVNLSIGLSTLLEAIIPREPGNIAFISHSGSLMAGFLTLSSVRGFYVNKAISTGNEAVTTLNDYLEYFIEDPEVNVIAMYVEAIRDGRRFLELCSSTTKSLVALKAGRTSSGRAAARSHTAALAGSVEVWSSVCKQVGIIQARTFNELYDIAVALACPLRPKGKRVGIVSAPGGPAVVAADACEELGLMVPRLSIDSIEKLRSILPPFASTSNPVDMSASVLEDVSVYEGVLDVVCSDPNIDSVIVMPPLMRHLVDVAAMVIDAVERYRKPVIVSWTIPIVPEVEELRRAVRLLGKNLIPNYYMPERAARAVAALWDQTQIEMRKRGRPKVSAQ
ncbi:MAG: CoA-binding protein [Candidatus Nezhaarchaeota archaeon]|nr:CoA-binding protein [Candidatus Nezhaarchaeota archaeon]MCX8142594.1 CoA-binding protein [Candidatus Nezhaarchaeota archaeon]